MRRGRWREERGLRGEEGREMEVEVVVLGRAGEISTGDGPAGRMRLTIIDARVSGISITTFDQSRSSE